MRCSVHNCLNDTKTTTKSHGITFHVFPKDPKLRLVWLDSLGLSDWEPRQRSAICSEHFRSKDFYETRSGLRKVKDGAVPVVDLNTYEDLDAPAALRVCRICLATGDRLYHIKDYKLHEMFEDVTGLNLNEDDQMPHRLCWECKHRLATCSRFKHKAIRTRNLLLDILNSSGYISLRDIKSINRAHNHLKTNLIQKHYKPNIYDLRLHDNEIMVKPEPYDVEDYIGAIPETAMQETAIPETAIPETAMPETAMPEMAVPETEIPDIQVKNEAENEIYFDEYVDNSNESEDDKKLSEIYVAPKRKKKKVTMRKKIRVVKKREEDESPMSTVDKYKVNDVKRRKTQDRLDESLFTISKLTYEEQIAEIQKRQETSNYKNSLYKCNICFRGFHIKYRYDAHNIRHSEQNGAFECFICKTRMKSGRALRKHLTAQHTEKYSCKGCPFNTRNRGVAREHQKWHAGTKYHCPHCPSEFDKMTTYMGHIRIKHVSDFVCELCGFTFVSKKGIDVHKKKKHRLIDKTVQLEGPYCEVCDVRFISEEAYERHLKLSSKHSTDNDPNKIRNDSQSINTEKNGRVMRKIERRPVIHPRDPNDRREMPPSGPITCEQCGIQLRDLRLYAQHFRRTHPDKNRTKYPAMKTPCMCEQCGKIFQSMALLKDHMWVHTGEKRFKCDRCSKSFTQKTNLMFHMRAHSATRPSYECPLCGKHFAFYNNRRRHMFIHTGLKPFKCETCGKCFTTGGELRAHVEHVHLKKPWPKRVRAHRTRDDHALWQQKCTDQE